MPAAPLVRLRQRRGRPGPPRLRRRRRPRRPPRSARRRSATSSASRSPTTGWCATSSTAAGTARRADQQRDLRPHRRERAAAGHEPAAGGRARPDRRSSPRPAASARSSPRTATSSGPARRVHPRTVAASGPARRLAAVHDGRHARSAPVPEWVLVAVALAALARRLARLAGPGGRGRPPGAARATGEQAHELSRTSDGSWSSSRPTTRRRTSSRIVDRLRAAVPDGRTCWSSTTTARTAPASSPTSWPPPTTACTCCTGPARPASARPTSPGSAGPREHGYDVVVEMDADGSHAPEQLPRLLAALRGRRPRPRAPAGCPAARCVNWPRRRLLLSRGGNLYTRLLLRLPLRDATGGYRAYRRSRPRRAARSTTSPRRATASRSTWPGGPAARAPGGRGADHLHRARVAAEQDEPLDRCRGAVAGHRVGADRLAALPGRPARGPRAGDGAEPCRPLLGVVLRLVGRGGRWSSRRLVRSDRRRLDDAPAAGDVALGGWLVRREGARAWRDLPARRWPQRPAAGPGRGDAGLVAVGGLLMVLPGFVGDLLGLLCLLPVTRGCSGGRWPAGARLARGRATVVRVRSARGRPARRRARHRGSGPGHRGRDRAAPRRGLSGAQCRARGPGLDVPGDGAPAGRPEEVQERIMSTIDSRVDDYIAALLDWQQDISGRSGNCCTTPTRRSRRRSSGPSSRTSCCRARGRPAGGEGPRHGLPLRRWPRPGPRR